LWQPHESIAPIANGPVPRENFALRIGCACPRLFREAALAEGVELADPFANALRRPDVRKTVAPSADPR
jgi:hypothetical protein